MTWQDAQRWSRFYGNLIAVAAVNGVINWFWFTLGAGLADVSRLVDLRSIGWKGAGWTLAGTVLVRIGGALSAHLMPEPNPPPPP